MARKAKDAETHEEVEKVKPPLTGETELLKFTGSTSAKYMTAQGMCIRIRPDEPPVETPVEFVEQRLAEGCWKKVKKPAETKEVKE